MICLVMASKTPLRGIGTKRPMGRCPGEAAWSMRDHFDNRLPLPRHLHSRSEQRILYFLAGEGKLLHGAGVFGNEGRGARGPHTSCGMVSSRSSL